MKLGEAVKYDKGSTDLHASRNVSNALNKGNQESLQLYSGGAASTVLSELTAQVEVLGHFPLAHRL